jgi:hypothetical protein
MTQFNSHSFFTKSIFSLEALQEDQDYTYISNGQIINWAVVKGCS